MLKLRPTGEQGGAEDEFQSPEKNIEQQNSEEKFFKQSRPQWKRNALQCVSANPPADSKTNLTIKWRTIPSTML